MDARLGGEPGEGESEPLVVRIAREEAVAGGTLDYALVRLNDSPGYRWGTTQISSASPVKGVAITII